MIEIQHDLMSKTHRNYVSIVYMGSCRIYIINSRAAVRSYWFYIMARYTPEKTHGT